MVLEAIAEGSFWLSLLLLGYTYIGYPVLIWIISQARARPVARAPVTPTVTLIIAAYNEQQSLRAKLENTLALDYPAEKLQIIVVSDCSTDRTDDIAREFASRGVILYRQRERLGKTAAQNFAVRFATNEIVVFSDATTSYCPDVLRKILANFADPSVGCVTGRLVYAQAMEVETNVGLGAKWYWEYETFLKRVESRAGSLIGASGCLYAVRRSAYVPLSNDSCSDFIIAARCVEQALRTVFEPAAVAVENTNTHAKLELRMRIRVIAQTYGDLWRNRALLNPFRYRLFAVQLISHKVLRYCVPVFLTVSLCASIWLANTSSLYALIAFAQVCFWLVAAFSILLDHSGRSVKFLAAFGYFAIANAAAVLALYQFLKGNRFAHWEPIRDPSPAQTLTGEELFESDAQNGF